MMTYLFRFYRDGNLVHAQSDTLRKAAFLVAESGLSAEIAHEDSVIGNMDIDGVITWSTGVEDRSVEFVVRFYRLVVMWHKEAKKWREDERGNSEIARTLDMTAEDLLRELRR